MRGAAFGVVVGVIAGVVIGATVIGPRLAGQRAITAERVDLPERLAPLEPVAEVEPEKPVALAKSVIRWRMSSAYPAALPLIGGLAKRVEDGIWQLSGGGMEIRMFEPGALVASRDMFQAVSSGTIEAAFGSPGMWAEQASALELFSAIPFGPRPAEYVAWIYFGGGLDLMQELYARHDVHALVCGLGVPEASGWFRNEISTVADFSSLRMRIGGMGAKVLRRLGATTLEIDGGDIFLAFEKQEINAAEYSIPAVDLKLGFSEFANHYYFPGWQQPSTVYALLIHRPAWDALAPADQARVEALCGDNVRQSLAEGEAEQFDALKKLMAKDVTLHRWPDAVLDRLREAWQEVVKEEADADADFAKVWESLSAFRRRYAIWSEINQP